MNNKPWMLIRSVSGELVWGNCCDQQSAVVYCCMAPSLEEATRRYNNSLATRATELFGSLKGEPLDELRLHKEEFLELLSQL